MKGGEAPLTCDLHLHTSYSDGTDPPRRVVERAAETGLAALAITDHDTVAGVAEGKAAARDLGLGFLAGTELSAAWHKAEIHVVGLGIRVDEPALRATLDELQRGRARRIDRIIERLEALGISIARDELASPASGALGRMHIARRIHALGFARTVQEAFDKYIGKARPAFVDKPRLDAAEAIGLIRGAGGLAFVGH
ncbi:MAG: PHP domain-containing protein, partial [Candidatus Hydrogenedentes bacterium]|nr:PHP domain-containing protein [Candidatus Hydrogenedentota bacterium]